MRNEKSWARLRVPAVLLLALVFAPAAQADQIDQSFLTCCQFNIPSFGPNRLLGQTFTAGITGELTGVTFGLLVVTLFDSNNNAIGPGTVTISIRDVTSSGAPGTNILGSTTVSGSFNTTNLIPFPSGVFLLAGTQYAIVLQAGANSQATWRGMLNDLYAGGAAYDTGLGGPTAWQPVTFNGQGLDFSFQTTMRPVPEPGTLLLLGSGLAGLWFRRRRG